MAMCFQKNKTHGGILLFDDIGLMFLLPECNVDSFIHNATMCSIIHAFKGGVGEHSGNKAKMKESTSPRGCCATSLSL